MKNSFAKMTKEELLAGICERRTARAALDKQLFGDAGIPQGESEVELFEKRYKLSTEISNMQRTLDMMRTRHYCYGAA